MARTAALTRPRLFAWIAGLFLAAFVLGPAAPTFLPAARAQDEKKDEKKEPEAAAPSGDAKSPSILMHMVKSAGIFFGPLLLAISIALVALIVLLAMDLRLSSAIP